MSTKCAYSELGRKGHKGRKGPKEAKGGHSMKPLEGEIAVVAGATRGAGRGIACALGEAGATVVCTGRSSRDRTLVSDYNRAETIEETAELVSSLGGTGTAIAVDHPDPDPVRRLADRVRSNH